MEPADGTGRAVNKVGDVCTFFLKAQEGVITEAAFQAQGCAATIIAASIATSWLLGQAVPVAQRLEIDALASQVGGLPQQKIARANVAVVAIQVAAQDYLDRHGSTE